MSLDYKYAAQMRAEEIAEEEFGRDYSDLPDDVQCTLYQRGLDAHWESLLNQADNARKAARERQA